MSAPWSGHGNGPAKHNNLRATKTGRLGFSEIAPLKRSERIHAMNIIDQLDKEQTEALGGDHHPDFTHGDTVKVWVKVREGEKERLQAYEGLVIARAGPASMRASPSARFPTAKASSASSRCYSPNVDRIEVLKRGKVRRAKLYYLRDRRGKSARIFESTNARTKKIQDDERTPRSRPRTPARPKRSPPPRPWPANWRRRMPKRQPPPLPPPRRRQPPTPPRPNKSGLIALIRRPGTARCRAFSLPPCPTAGQAGNGKAIPLRRVFSNARLASRRDHHAHTLHLHHLRRAIRAL